MDLPNVFDHADFRRYLTAWFAAKKNANPRFSHRAFARKLGSSDPSLLLNVINGRRSLTDDRLEPFTAALGLDGDAAAYFRLLVRFGQAERPDERERVYAEIAVLRTRLQGPEIDSSRFLFASDRLIPAVAALAECDGFDPDPAAIARRLHATVEQADHALALLLRLGFLVRDGDRIVPAEPVVRTNERVAHLGSFGYHTQNLRLAAEQLDRLWDVDSGTAEHTAFLGLTLSVPHERLRDLRKLLWEAHLKVLHEVETWTHRDQVVQVNIQMFPVSEITTDASAITTEKP
ncbi:MAG: TIGR02147 family protein [Myxococcota bacterium]